MTIPLFYPPVNYVSKLELGSPLTLEELCLAAGVKCRATGAFTRRELEITEGDELRITAEPGDWGRVRIQLKASSPTKAARLALSAMAYGLNDLVARESIRGAAWTKIKARVGRPRIGKALTNKERQRRFQARKLAS